MNNINLHCYYCNSIISKFDPLQFRPRYYPQYYVNCDACPVEYVFSYYSVDKSIDLKYILFSFPNNIELRININDNISVLTKCIFFENKIIHHSFYKPIAQLSTLTLLLTDYKHILNKINVILAFL